MSLKKTKTSIVLIVLTIGILSSNLATAQAKWDYLPPRGYVAHKVEQPLTIDGKAEKAWDNAPWSNYFNDIEGSKKPKPRFKTRMKMLWDAKYLYVYAELEEPHVWSYQTKRDCKIFIENDFEMFIKPSTMAPTYGEFEMNARGTVWDLYFHRPYRSGANYMESWDMRDIVVGVDVQGTINNPADIDKGWSVEVAFPWSALRDLGRKSPCNDGDIWRVNFSRVEWEQAVSADGKYIHKVGPHQESLKEDNWTWSPQRVVQMHEPEYWGYFQLSTKTSGSVAFKRPQEETILQTLIYLLRAKRENMEAKTIQALIGDDKIQVKGFNFKAEMQESLFGFYIIITNVDNGERYAIDELEVIKKL